ncbi:MAG: hypothetical protein LBV12_05915, partial [Puniceicoccales bacterium]|nr:hypothetical protein [Puniceicoccales bacterium]
MRSEIEQAKHNNPTLVHPTILYSQSPYFPIPYLTPPNSIFHLPMIAPHPVSSRSTLSASRILHRLHQCFAIIVSAVMICPPPLLLMATNSAGPDWWTERQVIASDTVADDYAALNQGQLKNLAVKAAQAMEAQLAGGAGTNILSMVNAWSQPAASGTTRDDYAVVTLGQLKAVAKPFYDRLIAAGIANAYPWANAATPADDYAVANLGQAKYLFSFEIPSTLPAYSLGKGSSGSPDTIPSIDNWYASHESASYNNTILNLGQSGTKAWLQFDDRVNQPSMTYVGFELRNTTWSRWNGVPMGPYVFFRFNGITLAGGNGLYVSDETGTLVEVPYAPEVMQPRGWAEPNENPYEENDSKQVFAVCIDNVRKQYSIYINNQLAVSAVPFTPSIDPKLEFLNPPPLTNRQGLQVDNIMVLNDPGYFPTWQANNKYTFLPTPIGQTLLFDNFDGIEWNSLSNSSPSQTINGWEVKGASRTGYLNVSYPYILSLNRNAELARNMGTLPQNKTIALQFWLKTYQQEGILQPILSFNGVELALYQQKLYSRPAGGTWVGATMDASYWAYNDSSNSHRRSYGSDRISLEYDQSGKTYSLYMNGKLLLFQQGYTPETGNSKLKFTGVCDDIFIDDISVVRREIGSWLMDVTVDTDGDGIPDYWERRLGSNPLVADADNMAPGTEYTYAQRYAALAKGLHDPAGILKHNDNPIWENIYDTNPGGIEFPATPWMPGRDSTSSSGTAPGTGSTPTIPQFSSNGDLAIIADIPLPTGCISPPQHETEAILMEIIEGAATVYKTRHDDCTLDAAECGIYPHTKNFPSALDNGSVYSFSINVEGLDMKPLAPGFEIVYDDYVFTNSLSHYKSFQWDREHPEHKFSSTLNATGRIIGNNAAYESLPSDKNQEVSFYASFDYQRNKSIYPPCYSPGMANPDDEVRGPEVIGSIMIFDHETGLTKKSMSFGSYGTGEDGCPLQCNLHWAHSLKDGHGIPSITDTLYYGTHIKGYKHQKMGGASGLQPGKRYPFLIYATLEFPTKNANYFEEDIVSWDGRIICNIEAPPNSKIVIGEFGDEESKAFVQKNWLIFSSQKTVFGDSAMTSYYMSCSGYIEVGHPLSEPTASADDASGALYRKIALNGQPLPDEKPQAAPESDQHPEETFVDALTLQLRHQTTDAYLAVPGSDLAIQVRRNAAPEIWNHRYGQRPWEKIDLPFGVSWSSNLSPNIRFIKSVGTVQTPPEVPTAVVTDEQGASYRFLMRDDGTYFPFPSAKHEQASYLCSLEKIGNNYIFTKKFGTKLIFESIARIDAIASDRMIELVTRKDVYQYARLVSISDRLGNQIKYDYSASDAASPLVPCRIYVDGRPELKIDIQASNGLVTDIWDATGYRTSYHYSHLCEGVRALERVTHADGNETRYGYDLLHLENDNGDPDQRPKENTPANPDPQYYHFHCDLARITDSNGHVYKIDYQLDKSRWEYISSKNIYYQKTGIPRNVAKSTLPNENFAEFFNDSDIKYYSSGSAEKISLNGESRRQTRVKNAEGYTRTYTWSDPDVAVVKIPPSFAVKSPPPPNPIIVYYQKMTVSMPMPDGNDKQEIFTFDPNAGLALARATDRSGNTTTYTYEDPVPTAEAYNENFEAKVTGDDPENQVTTRVYLNRFFDDPNSQTNALGFTKTFAYNSRRIMKAVTDELGRKTVYDVDEWGRRTSETLFDLNEEIIQQTDFEYGDPRFRGFITRKIVHALDSRTPDLITNYEADPNGRISREIVAPGTLDLVTSYTYSPNGDKLTATNPRGHTTAFWYDKRHRLIRAFYPNYTLQDYAYDARGNKIKETDERGNITEFKYDTLNRLIETTRRMGGSVPDIVTRQTYNAINAISSTTDANGNMTILEYDDLGRLISKISPEVPIDQNSTGVNSILNPSYSFEYGSNAGGS